MTPMGHGRPASIARVRAWGAVSSWRGLLAATLIASACVSAIPLQRSIGLFTATRVNASVVSSSNLEAPAALNANATGPGSVALNWSQSTSAYASGYEVYRLADGEDDYSLIATQLGLANTSYTDNGLMPSTGYTYYVVSLYENWTSGHSPPAIAITPAS